MHPANDFASPSCDSAVLEANAKIRICYCFSESLPCNSETLTSHTQEMSSPLLPFLANDISLRIISEIFYCIS